jgi:DNA-binding IclR family transcriptional regulator
LAKYNKKILKLLESSNASFSLDEIAEKLEIKPKAVFRSLRSLFQKGEITRDPHTRKYSLVKSSE